MPIYVNKIWGTRVVAEHACFRLGEDKTLFRLRNLRTGNRYEVTASWFLYNYVDSRIYNG